MTFVQYGNRAFLDRSILKPLRRRSESRLKTYPSSIDLRTWCDTVEERRQHIIEHIRKDIEKCYGKLIPIDAIINALTGARVANCEAISKCFQQLIEFVDGLKLSNEDSQKLNKLKAQMDRRCGVGSGDSGGLKSLDRAKRSSASPSISLLETLKANSMHEYRVFQGQHSDDCDPDCVANPRHEKERAEIENLVKKTPGQETAKQPRIITTFRGPGSQKTRIRGISPGFVVGPTTEEPGNITVKAQGPSKVKTKISNAYPAGRTKRSENSDDGTDGSMPKSKSDSACERLRDKLAATEALCQEQQAKLAELQKERDDLKQKLGDCMRELENFKKLNTVTNPELPSSCKEEIEALEAEIKIMRSGNPSPEQEAEIIKKEIDVLKRYCTKLKQIEDENVKLKSQLSVNKGVGDQGGMMDDLKEKLDNLDKITKERDTLANKVHMLEQKLKQYEDLPSDVEKLKNRSQMLDVVMKERDDMSQKCKAMKDVEKEIAQLRAKAERADELERELKSYSKYERNSGSELKRTQSMCGCLENELKNVKSEKEAMNRRIENMRKELDSNKSKIKENEILRLERDRLQIQLNQLHGIQEERDHYKAKYDEIIEMECKCEMLKRQLDDANSVSRERDHLKKQVEDLESCICDQENEIKSLVMQVDNASRNSNADTEHLLNTMKNEIKSSNDKLMSEKAKILQLETMLHKAEQTIRQKECHIKCLEAQIRSSKKLNQEELEQVECMCNKLDAANAESKKLQEIANKMACLAGDQQVKKMLQQSECTAKRLVEELGKQYKGWDNAKHKNYGDIHSKNNKKNFCKCQSTDESDDCEKLRKELQSLEKEKQTLEQNIKQMQKPGEAKCRC